MDIIKSDETLDDLQLKGIKVIQKKEGFRFGVDAVMLANFSKVKRNHRVIDLCTGTGIIPFIISGKTECKNILGIEIQKEFVDMANRTSNLNNLNDKVKFLKGDLTNINMLKKIEKADVVTVNPPYKLFNSGIVNPTDRLAIARHEVCCNLEDVIVAARILLKDNGRFFMVHRPDRLADIFTVMRKHKIEPKRVRMVHPVPNKAPNIVLVEGQRDGGAFLKWDDPLNVHNTDGTYSDEIIKMYNSDSI
ncbi:tRNA1(Val) (adenine(37)-N6)-methyltransferase [Clostridium senegalense]